MSEKSEDNIENFFRKAVAQQDKTFLERDWQQMEKMLDAQGSAAATVRNGKVKTYSKIAGAVVILLSLTFTGVKYFSKSNEGPSREMQAAAGDLGPQQEVKKGATADLHSSDQQKSVSDEKKTETSSEDKKADQSNALSKHALTYSTSALGNSVSIKTGDLKEKASPEQNPPVQGSEDSLYENTSDQATLAPSSKDSEASEEQLLKNAEQHSVVEAGKEEIQDKEKLGEELKPEAEESAIVQEDKKEQNESFVSRWNVAIAYSPDFSTTSLSEYTRPGTAYGLSIGYKIFNRITITTGFVRSLKIYGGYGRDYQPPEGYWERRTNGIVPDEVTGRCGIIEIPVIVQVDLLQRERWRVFASTGISSYLMRHESYRYTFYEPNPGAADSWKANEPSSYKFSIAHFSASYERKLNQRFALGIEPFIKVPLKGIGWTNVNLFTTGAFVNLRYNILKTKLN